MMIALATTCIATNVIVLDVGIDAERGPTIDTAAPVTVSTMNHLMPAENRDSHQASTAANAAAMAVDAATTTTFSAVVSSLPGDVGISTSPSRFDAATANTTTLAIAATSATTAAAVHQPGVDDRHRGGDRSAL